MRYLARCTERGHHGCMENTPNAASLTRLLNEADIRDTIARFAVAATRADVDSWRALWDADAEWVIGSTDRQPFESRATGLDDIVSMFRHLRDTKEYFVQFAVPGAIEIDGGNATVRCLCYEAARGPGEYYRNTGIDTVQLRRSARGWVFTRRSYQYLWLDLGPYSGDVFPV
jgi:ketosteroid isomerase-like protein